MEKESEIDWNGEAFPLGFRPIQLGQRADLSWDQAETALKRSWKTKSARVTSANNLASGYFEHVAVLGSETDAAELASPRRRARLREAAQGGEYSLLITRR